TTPVQLQTVTSGALDVTHPTASGSFVLGQAQLFHFVLSANAGGAANVSVRLKIVDRSGAVVGSVAAADGQSVSLTPFLAAGTYSIRFDAVTGSGQAVPVIGYVLRGLGISDPIGPEEDDPTGTPAASPGPGASTSTTT